MIGRTHPAHMHPAPTTATYLPLPLSDVDQHDALGELLI